MEDARHLEDLVCTIKYCRAACETGLLGFLLDTFAGQPINSRYDYSIKTKVFLGQGKNQKLLVTSYFHIYG